MLFWYLLDNVILVLTWQCYSGTYLTMLFWYLLDNVILVLTWQCYSGTYLTMLFCMSLVCSLILLSSSLRRCCSGEKCAFISALTSWLWSAEGSTSSVFLATGSPQLGDSFTMRALVASAYFQNKKGFLYNKHLRNTDFHNSSLVRYLNINGCANWKKGKYSRMVIVWNSKIL